MIAYALKEDDAAISQKCPFFAVDPDAAAKAGRRFPFFGRMRFLLMHMRYILLGITLKSRENGLTADGILSIVGIHIQTGRTPFMRGDKYEMD